MYIPEFNRVTDPAEAIAFVRDNPFAILISSSNDGPFATHIPILIREQAGKTILHGHLAKANPHCALLESEADALAIFHGPHAYISPSLYESRESVPTWNYAAVHIYGAVRTVSDPAELMEETSAIIHRFDPAYFPQWTSLSDKFQQGMLKHIVGFELTAKKIEAKYKISQNRTKKDQASIIEALGKSADTAVSGIAALMKKEGLGVLKS